MFVSCIYLDIYFTLFAGFKIQFNTDEGKVTVTGVTGKGGCIQLEVKYKGNDDWQECGGCITADTTVILSVHCPAGQTRRRRAAGDVEDVRSRICYRTLCSDPIVAEKGKFELFWCIRLIRFLCERNNAKHSYIFMTEETGC